MPVSLCSPHGFEGAEYLVCPIPLTGYRVTVGHNAVGAGRTETVADNFAALETASDAPLLVMNGGMYREDLSALGLLIENGQTVRGLNRADAVGNFYLKPNGVFWIDDAGNAVIEETEAFAGADRDPAFATQSGPLLVSRRALHPSISHDGQSRHIRNGVGVREDGQVVLVISRFPVSLGALARLFRDELDCPDVLYLDGVVSALATEGGLHVGGRYPAGPVIVVERR